MSLEAGVNPYVASRVRVVADSVAPCGVRLTTWECDYPRYIHAELMTHRMLSRNGRSSRAEPLARVVDRAVDDPVRPLVWMYDARRMAHGDAMSPEDAEHSESLWWESRDNQVRTCREYLRIGMHRQYAIRILEPYLRIKMVISATSFNNLYALRIHPAPMPEIQQLVVGMARTQGAGTPRPLAAGQWHLPYVTEHERRVYPTELLLKVSTSRLARLSYDSIDGKVIPIEDDVRLHDQLVAADPKHASPAEHPGMATGDRNLRSGNYRGYVQYRHTILGESAPDEGFDLDARLVQYEGRDYIA